MTRSPRTPSEVRALMRGAPEMLASAKIPDRVQRLAEREGPRDETISATLLKIWQKRAMGRKNEGGA